MLFGCGVFSYTLALVVIVTRGLFCPDQAANFLLMAPPSVRSYVENKALWPASLSSPGQ